MRVKSVIIVALSVIQALRGYNVDVVTSSNILAKRDAGDKQIVEIYKMFGILSDHNCSELPEERKKAYHAKVVYGEVGAFQRDQLLDQFYGQNLLGEKISR